MRRLRTRLVAVALSWGSVVTHAHAGPPADTAAAAPDADSAAEAKRHFDQGVALYEEQDFRGAQFEFERAHALSGNYRILYNIALASLDAHDYAGAKRAFEGYLAQGGDSLAADRRAECERELATLAPRVGSLALKVDVAGATISLDGRDVGTAPLAEDLLVNLGERRLVVSATGYAPAEKVFDVEGGERTVLRIRLQRLPDRAAQARDTPVPAPRAERSNVPDADGTAGADRRLRALKISTWVGLAMTGAGTAAAITTGILALRANRDLRAARDEVPQDPLRVDSLQSRTKRLALATDVAASITGAFAVATLALGISAIVTSKRARARSHAHLDPKSLTLRF